MTVKKRVEKKYRVNFGADLGFDEIHETQGACPGAVCLVKSRKTIIANDETFALAAQASHRLKNSPIVQRIDGHPKQDSEGSTLKAEPRNSIKLTMTKPVGWRPSG